MGNRKTPGHRGFLPDLAMLSGRDLSYRAPIYVVPAGEAQRRCSHA